MKQTTKKKQVNRLTKSTKISMRRDYLIVQLYNEGFFGDEIAKLFRLTKGRVFQILQAMTARENLSVEQLAKEDQAMTDFLKGRQAIKVKAKEITAKHFARV